MDPNTGWHPEDPFTGLLYPEDGTGRGQGHISYIVESKADLPSGTRIENRARIYFDYNDPIDTPLVWNTLDAGAPTSRVHSLEPVVVGESLMLEWSGEDDEGGSGVASYDVYFSVDGGPFVLLLIGTPEVSYEFFAERGREYAFLSVARDHVGHVEPFPESPDTVVWFFGPNPWHNYSEPYDVSGDGRVNPFDVLLIVSELVNPTFRNPETGLLPSIPALDRLPPPYLDVDNNGIVNPFDVLLVVSYLVQPPEEDPGEGEASLTARENETPETTALRRVWAMAATAMFDLPPAPEDNRAELAKREVAQRRLIELDRIGWDDDRTLSALARHSHRAGMRTNSVFDFDEAEDIRNWRMNPTLSDLEEVLSAFAREGNDSELAHR